MPKPPRTIALGVTIAAVVMGVRLVTDVAQPSASVGAVVAAEPAPSPQTPLSHVGSAATPEPTAPTATLDPDSPRRLEMARYLAPDGLESFIAANAAEPGPPLPAPGGPPILGPLAEHPTAPAVPR